MTDTQSFALSVQFESVAEADSFFDAAGLLDQHVERADDLHVHVTVPAATREEADRMVREMVADAGVESFRVTTKVDWEGQARITDAN
jgi:hypothetical protein